jgi:hypothetical protein
MSRSEIEDEDEVTRMGKALAVWALRNNVRARKIQDKTGWTYNHAWRVLRGIDPFSPAAWGTFIKAFGLEAFQEIARIARVDLTGKESNVETK